MPWQHFFWIAIGGGCGALLRSALFATIATTAPGFPWGTSLVNILGSFAAGLLYPWLDRWSPPVRPLVLTGFFGALTTMSTFSVEVVALIGEKRFLLALMHWMGGAFLCVGMAALGVYIAGRLGA